MTDYRERWLRRAQVLDDKDRSDRVSFLFLSNLQKVIEVRQGVWKRNAFSVFFFFFHTVRSL